MILQFVNMLSPHVFDVSAQFYGLMMVDVQGFLDHPLNYGQLLVVKLAACLHVDAVLSIAYIVYGCVHSFQFSQDAVSCYDLFVFFSDFSFSLFVSMIGKMSSLP